MHELVHLDFAVQARKKGVNKLFVSRSEHRTTFARDLEKHLEKLVQMGIAEDTIHGYISSIFNGISMQIFNIPVDMFIETFLYNEYPELRPYQFHSLYNLSMEGLHAVTHKEIVSITPPRVMFASKVYNLLNACLLRDLFGVDIVNDFNPTNKEMKVVENLFEQFKLYVETRESGEEYELIRHWARELDVDGYFDLVDEQEYRQSASAPLGNGTDKSLDAIRGDETAEEKHKRFLEHHQDAEMNMAVAMFMVEALEFFENMPVDDIKVIAFEIALKGTHGYSPNKDNYEIVSMPGKVFSGYRILAYYYVSWSLATPEMLPQLQLPFDKEYTFAKEFVGERKTR